MARRVLEALCLPPCSALALLLAGTAIKKWWRRTGRSLQIAGFAWLWLAATPIVGGALLSSLQTSPPLPATGELPPADAIVVLAAEADRVGAEFGGAVAGPVTMQRVRYGVALHQRTGLPVLVSGGSAGTGAPTLAATMAAAAREYGVDVRWREERSADTRENARFSAELLKAAGVKRILLVTSAWHMPRSAACFRAEGFDVVPAPTAFRTPSTDSVLAFVPHWYGLRDTSLALHELMGRVWYSLTSS